MPAPVVRRRHSLGSLPEEVGVSERQAINRADVVLAELLASPKSQPARPAKNERIILPDITLDAAAAASNPDGRDTFMAQVHEWFQVIGKVLAENDHLLEQLEKIFGTPGQARGLLLKGGIEALECLSHLLRNSGLGHEMDQFIKMLEQLKSLVPSEADPQAPQRLIEALCKDAVALTLGVVGQLPDTQMDQCKDSLTKLIEAAVTEHNLAQGLRAHLDEIKPSVTSMEEATDRQTCQATVQAAGKVVDALLHGLDRAEQAQATREASAAQAGAKEAAPAEESSKGTRAAAAAAAAGKRGKRSRRRSFFETLSSVKPKQTTSDPEAVKARRSDAEMNFVKRLAGRRHSLGNQSMVGSSGSRRSQRRQVAGVMLDHHGPVDHTQLPHGQAEEYPATEPIPSFRRSMGGHDAESKKKSASRRLGGPLHQGSQQDEVLDAASTEESTLLQNKRPKSKQHSRRHSLPPLQSATSTELVQAAPNQVNIAFIGANPDVKPKSRRSEKPWFQSN